MRGHYYFLTVMVVDSNGNWDVHEDELDSLRRHQMIEFTDTTIYYDPDPGSHGEAQFFTGYRREMKGRPRQVLQLFQQPEMDVDDWSETRRPYTTYHVFAHPQPRTVDPDRRHIWISSWAEEDDSPESPEGDGSHLGKRLSLPNGPMEITSGSFKLDCAPSTDGSDFHYDVGVRFQVTYSP